MYPSNGLGGSSRTSVGHPTGSGDLSMPSELDARGRPSHRYHQYANIVPARPAPPPPTSGISGHPRRIANRRGSLGVVPPSVSGLSATRPMIQSDLQLPPLEPLLPSTRTSGIGRTRRRGAPGPRLGGGGELGSSLSMTGGLGDAPPPSLLSRSQPIDIVPLSPLASINDWRNRISPGSPLENPTLRETRREARHRARDDWERDAELRERRASPTSYPILSTLSDPS